ncbi:alkaline phosphatase D family protein [Streptomyces sp. NBC_00582]|uniref:alkaline phosphatase D family protein n=1 Tax=Streptomyces sp. NBC_00582 TaxID=2975783 RepID=UPI001062FD99|nr:alkaline phosphatase D family protein [Streptomyces sp. NBC_00582]WUB67955.1 alkaline phosphatase D family protein [Streptomyces sp. NBC_00582]
MHTGGTDGIRRRRFLGAGAVTLGAAGAAAAGQLLPGSASASVSGAAATAGAGTEVSGTVFKLGVASGDPLPNAIVLWTRVTPANQGSSGILPSSVAVTWELASDSGFATVVKSGTATASSSLGHSVHVDVTGLTPATDYWYRFKALGRTSITGRTRTAPAAGSTPANMRIALASCQNWQHGYFTAYRDMREQQPDLVLFVGDYIYESSAYSYRVRRHEGTGQPVTLAQYRARHEQYNTDPDLQAMRAAAPFVVVFDDHEVEQDWAGDVANDPTAWPTAKFLARRAAAFQAFYEHMPIRAAQKPSGPDVLMYRSLDFGTLARLHVLDTRQYRDDQATTAAGALKDGRVIMGDTQRTWLVNSMRASGARWNLVASQVMMAETDFLAGVGKEWSYDAWDGYQKERAALLAEFQDVRNPVVLSGDRHRTIVSDLKLDFDDPESAVVGAEFVGTSISSSGDEDLAAFAAEWAPKLADNPHWKMIDARRGYLLFDITADGIDARLRSISTVVTKNGTTTTAATFRVEDGVPGVHQVGVERETTTASTEQSPSPQETATTTAPEETPTGTDGPTDTVPDTATPTDPTTSSPSDATAETSADASAAAPSTTP